MSGDGGRQSSAAGFALAVVFVALGMAGAVSARMYPQYWWNRPLPVELIRWGGATVVLGGFALVLILVLVRHGGHVMGEIGDALKRTPRPPDDAEPPEEEAETPAPRAAPSQPPLYPPTAPLPRAPSENGVQS